MAISTDDDALAKRLQDDEAVNRDVWVAVRRALARHRARGNRVAVWKDGRPVLVEPPAAPDPAPPEPDDD